MDRIYNYEYEGPRAWWKLCCLPGPWKARWHVERGEHGSMVVKSADGNAVAVVFRSTDAALICAAVNEFRREEGSHEPRE